MNRIVFFMDGTIMTVAQGNRYLKSQIAVKRKYDGPIPYRFSTPYTHEEVESCWKRFYDIAVRAYPRHDYQNGGDERV